MNQPVTLNHLRELRWTHHGGSTTLLHHLKCPVLSDIRMILRPQCQSQSEFTRLSFILPPDNNLITLPLKLTNVRRHHYRSPVCHFGWSSASAEHKTSLTITSKVDDDGAPGPAFSHWFSQNDFPIDLSETDSLQVRAYEDDCPPLDYFPIRLFGSLRELSLAGKIDSLVEIIQVRHGEEHPIPCTSLSELCIFPWDDTRTFTPSKLKEVLEGRMNGGHKMKTVKISGLKSFPKAAKELEKVVEEPVTDARKKANRNPLSSILRFFRNLK